MEGKREPSCLMDRKSNAIRQIEREPGCQINRKNQAVRWIERENQAVRRIETDYRYVLVSTFQRTHPVSLVLGYDYKSRVHFPGFDEIVEQKNRVDDKTNFVISVLSKRKSSNSGI